MPRVSLEPPPKSLSQIRRYEAYMLHDRIICNAHTPDTVVLYRGVQCPLCKLLKDATALATSMFHMQDR